MMSFYIWEQFDNFGLHQRLYSTEPMQCTRAHTIVRCAANSRHSLYSLSTLKTTGRQYPIAAAECDQTTRHLFIADYVRCSENRYGRTGGHSYRGSTVNCAGVGILSIARRLTARIVIGIDGNVRLICAGS